MRSGDLPTAVKKNLLDLQYTKYLQYFTTSLIIIFTYFIGIAIAILTKQVDWHQGDVLFKITSASGIFLSVMVLVLLRFRDHMNNIIGEVKKLEM